MSLHDHIYIEGIGRPCLACGESDPTCGGPYRLHISGDCPHPALPLSDSLLLRCSTSGVSTWSAWAARTRTSAAHWTSAPAHTSGKSGEHFALTISTLAISTLAISTLAISTLIVCHRMTRQPFFRRYGLAKSNDIWAPESKAPSSSPQSSHPRHSRTLSLYRLRSL